MIKLSAGACMRPGENLKQFLLDDMKDVTELLPVIEKQRSFNSHDECGWLGFGPGKDTLYSQFFDNFTNHLLDLKNFPQQNFLKNPSFTVYYETPDTLETSEKNEKKDQAIYYRLHPANNGTDQPDEAVSNFIQYQKKQGVFQAFLSKYILTSPRFDMYDVSKNKIVDVNHKISLSNRLTVNNFSKLSEDDKNKILVSIQAREIEQQLYRNYAKLQLVYFALINAIYFSDNKYSLSEIEKEELINAAYEAGLLLYFTYRYQLNSKVEADGLYAELNNLCEKVKKPLPAWVEITEEQKLKKYNEENHKNSLLDQFLLWCTLNITITTFRTKIFPIILNLPRLWLIRFNREITVAVVYWHALQPAVNNLDWFFTVTGFSIFSIVFYLPRFFVNLALLCLHSFCESYMTDAEKALGWRVRLALQWERYGFQMMNDLVWFGINLLCYFLPTPFNMMVIVLLYVFDVWNCSRSLGLINRDCDELQSDQNIPDNPEDSQGVYNKGLKCIADEKRRSSKHTYGVAWALLIFMVPLGIYILPVWTFVASALVILGINTLAIGLSWTSHPWVATNRFRLPGMGGKKEKTVVNSYSGPSSIIPL